MEGQSPAFPPRNLGSLLDETFSVYARRPRFWIALVAVVQVPIGVLSLVVGQAWGGAGATATVSLIGLLGAVYVYGAAVYGLGQHYVKGETAIRECYARAWWRVRSLAALALLAVLVVAALVLPLSIGQRPWIGVVVVLLLAPAIALAVYWSMALQAVIVEGHMALKSLGRSLELVRGNWWRVLGVGLVLSLVALGLGIVVALPVAVASVVASADASSTVSVVLLELGRVAVAIAVTPVLFIAWTLLYYDIRVRNEEYNLATLSRELGMVAA